METPPDHCSDGRVPPPWLEPLWHTVYERVRAGRLPHALLLSGAQGVGKGWFADSLASALLCQKPAPDGLACGGCPRCKLFRAGSHPDFLRLNPEEKSTRIRIDQVRAHNEFIALTSQYGGYKVAVTEPADSMTVGAANSLLKTLEEPARNSILVLVTARPAALAATIRSRCQRLEIRRPDPKVVTPWLAERLPPATDPALLLQLAGGAPFRALALADGPHLSQRAALVRDLDALTAGREDPVAVAGRWHTDPGPNTAAYWLSHWLADMIRLKTGARADRLVNSDCLDVIRKWAVPVELRRMFALLDRVIEMNRLHLSQTNVNPQMLLEDLLIEWSAMGGRS